MSCLWKYTRKLFVHWCRMSVKITASFLQYNANWGPSYLAFFSLYITGSRSRLELLPQTLKCISPARARLREKFWARLVRKCNYYPQTHNMVIWNRRNLACEQALLFGRASPLACLSRVYFSRYPPNAELARRLGETTFGQKFKAIRQ